MPDTEILICAICNRDIREINCFPIYSKKHTDIICSQCCTLGALISLEIIDRKELTQIPIKIRREIIMIYKLKFQYLIN